MKMFVEPGDSYMYCGYLDFRKIINGLLIMIEHEIEHSGFNDMPHIRLSEQQLERLLSGMDVIGHQPLSYHSLGF